MHVDSQGMKENGVTSWEAVSLILPSQVRVGVVDSEWLFSLLPSHSCTACYRAGSNAVSLLPRPSRPAVGAMCFLAKANAAIKVTPGAMLDNVTVFELLKVTRLHPGSNG